MITANMEDKIDNTINIQLKDLKPGLYRFNSFSNKKLFVAEVLRNNNSKDRIYGMINEKGVVRFDPEYAEFLSNGKLPNEEINLKITF